jgi:hypothetical protein
MAPHIYSDDEDTPPRRPKRVAVPSAKVISADNIADLELHSHRKAHVTTNAVASHIQTPITVTAFDEDDSDIESLHSKTKQLTKGMSFFCFSSTDILNPYRQKTRSFCCQWQQ